MSALRYGALLDAVRGIRWPARSVVAAGSVGAHHSRQRGASGEFSEYRLHRQGDDPRRLDWKLLARSDRPFVRLHDDRALLPTWFLLDASASMNFPVGATSADGASAAVSKWNTACALTIGLASVAQASGDPVGLIVAPRAGLLRLEARSRRGTVDQIAHLLHATEVGADPPLTPLLLTIPIRSRVVVISDLLGDVDALLRVAAQRTTRGSIMECVHVVAAEELTLPAESFLARDPEDAATRRSSHRGAAERYRVRFDEFRRDVAHRWRAIGAGYREVCTADALSRAVRLIAANATHVADGDRARATRGHDTP